MSPYRESSAPVTSSRFAHAMRRLRRRFTIWWYCDSLLDADFDRCPQCKRRRRYMECRACGVVWRLA